MCSNATPDKKEEKGLECQMPENPTCTGQVFKTN